MPVITVTNQEYRSAVPGAIWPAIPDTQAATLLALQFQLDHSQRLAPDRLRALQFRQLEVLLRHACATVPFYRDRLAASGVDPAAPLTPDLFPRLPRMNRSDVQILGEALLSSKVPAGHGRITKGETSGSTGTPITYYGTELTQFFWDACTLRDHFWHGRDVTAKLAAVRKNMKDAVLPSWGPPVDILFRTGPAATLDINSDLDAQLEWLQVQAPAYLITAAHNLYWLARRSLERGIVLPNLRQVRSFGGVFPDDARRVIREAWNVPLVDVYTAEEVGYIALQCPECEHFHVQSENLIFEILDESGEPCQPGEIGRVVLTTLHNFAMPLVRYDIGDYAEAGAPCACGRGLPVITRILGRQRNLLTLPNGRRHWPSFPSEKWSHAGPIRQLQLVQQSLDHIEVRVVAERVLNEGEKVKLVSALQNCLGHPFNMSVRELADIPRAASHKFEDFISEVVS